MYLNFFLIHNQNRHIRNARLHNKSGYNPGIKYFEGQHGRSITVARDRKLIQVQYFLSIEEVQLE